MAIITKPSTIEKNSAASISLNKSDLALIPSVVADSYFSDQDNWKNVIVYYRSSIGNQKEILKFDATLVSPSTSFLISDKARDIFEVQKIIIQDFDGGSIVIPRSELTTAEFDIDTSGGSTPAGAIIWQSRPDYTPEPDGGATSTNTGYPDPSSIMYTVSPIDTSTDFTITYNIFSTEWVAYVYIGYCNQAKSSFSGFYKDTLFTSVLINNTIGNSLASLPTGGVSAELKIQKVDSTLYFKIDGITVHTTSASVLDSFIYPAVRLMQGNVNIISSSIV
jgi:hypothetical protein